MLATEKKEGKLRGGRKQRWCPHRTSLCPGHCFYQSPTQGSETCSSSDLPAGDSPVLVGGSGLVPARARATWGAQWKNGGHLSDRKGLAMRAAEAVLYCCCDYSEQVFERVNSMANY